MGEGALPFCAEAEEAALGSALLEPGAVLNRAETCGVREDAFFIPAHRMVWEALLAVYARRGAADALMVGEELERAGRLEKIGGAGFLRRLIDQTPTASHAAYYLDIVRQRATCRAVIAAARETEQAALRAENGDRELSAAVGRFTGIATQKPDEQSNEQVMDELVDRWRLAHEGGEPAIGLDMPWPLLTQLLCGLEVGLTVLAGRPSMGKTTIEDMAACHLARQGTAVGRVTLDSTRKELLSRALARTAGVSLPKLKYGHAGESNFARIAAARETIARWPMFVNDELRDIRGIAAQIRAWKLKHDIGLATVDYVQLVEAADMGRSQWDTNARVGYVSGILKLLALELEIPILLLAQLNRLIEKEGREPRMSDLRDSGCLEQDAHKIMFVYRDEKWCRNAEENEPGSTKKERLAWVDVLKHKDGETGRVRMTHRCHYFRFDEGEDLL
jgi:replicative DNA helicase